MKNIFYRVLSMSALLFFFQKSFSQVIISGPTCIVPSTVYQYVISGNWDSASSVQVCITAGIIIDSTDSTICTPSLNGLNKVLVMWNDSASDDGSLTVTSSLGNASLTVHFTQELLPGSIDSASKEQIINYGIIPAAITCGVDSGGSCSPSYSYQWQRSSNMVFWMDIPQATGQNLSIDSALAQSTFYRRKVTETSTGSIGYSDAAAVLVIVPPSDTTTQSDSLMNGSNSGFIQRPKTMNRKEFYNANAFASLQKQWMRRQNHFDEVHSL